MLIYAPIRCLGGGGVIIDDEEENGVDPHDFDWPEVAVLWCRAEGCTAPLLSELSDYESDSDHSSDDGGIDGMSVHAEDDAEE